MLCLIEVARRSTADHERRDGDGGQSFPPSWIRIVALPVDLADLALLRLPTIPLMRRAYDLRANVTAYDAAYVALAEHLEQTLVTADAGLARAPGIRCSIEVLG